MENILVVEDDAVLRKICVKHLERPGRIIRNAEDGQAAIDAIAREQPDLLLLDILLPGMDGFSVLEFIRERGYTFPVIIFSNVTWDFNGKSLKEIGVAEYFIKSNIDIPELVEKVEQHLPKSKDLVNAW